jgi:hypothetical protein
MEQTRIVKTEKRERGGGIREGWREKKVERREKGRRRKA